MTLYFVLKFLHIIGACVLLGTGAGIAFFMLMAHLNGKPAVVAAVARIVVLADFLFTASAVVVQPITGAWLAYLGGYPIFSGWIFLSIILYVITGGFWPPVVWFQMRMRDLAEQAAAAGTELPAEYHSLFRSWFWYGFPAFFSVMAIVALMITKPDWP